MLLHTGHQGPPRGLPQIVLTLLLLLLQPPLHAGLLCQTPWTPVQVLLACCFTQATQGPVQGLP